MTINGDAADIIEKNKLGYCAHPNNITKIAEVFKIAIQTDKEQIEEFTKNCQVLTDTVFNKNKIIDSLLKLLREGEKQ